VEEKSYVREEVRCPLRIPGCDIGKAGGIADQEIGIRAAGTVSNQNSGKDIGKAVGIVEKSKEYEVDAGCVANSTVGGCSNVGGGIANGSKSNTLSNSDFAPS